MKNGNPPLTNRERLIQQARTLFAEQGFAAVSVDQIAAAAGLTKGAVYYQFKDKTDLFRAVFESVLVSVGEAVDEGTMGITDHHIDEVVIGSIKWINAYESAQVRQIVLIDGPAVLGMDDWMRLQEPVGMALIAHALGHLVDDGQLEAALVPALSQMLFGAFTQGALRIALSAEPEATSQEVRAATHHLTLGLLNRKSS